MYVFFSFFRCIAHRGGGPWWCQPIGNPCKCDSPFVWEAFRQIWSCSSLTCRWHALQVFSSFMSLLSCWFPVRFCFPWIRFVCRCKYCLCPRIVIYWRCIFLRCALSLVLERFLLDLIGVSA